MREAEARNSIFMILMVLEETTYGWSHEVSWVSL
jgi:hypothetical protein